MEQYELKNDEWVLGVEVHRRRPLAGPGCRGPQAPPWHWSMHIHMLKVRDVN